MALNLKAVRKWRIGDILMLGSAILLFLVMLTAQWIDLGGNKGAVTGVTYLPSSGQQNLILVFIAGLGALVLSIWALAAPGYSRAAANIAVFFGAIGLVYYVLTFFQGYQAYQLENEGVVPTLQAVLDYLKLGSGFWIALVLLFALILQVVIPRPSGEQNNSVLYVMLIPCLIAILFFRLYPLWGLSMAFVDYSIVNGLAGSEWVGMENFEKVFGRPQTGQIIKNTVVIAVGKIVSGQVAAVLFALLMNEVANRYFKRVIQTITTFPHFLSWVIIGGLLISLLASGGPINRALESLGLEGIGFLSDRNVFPLTLIFSNVWKEFGFGAVIYMAALTQIDPNLYEAAAVDGAGRFHRLWHITLPGIRPTIILMATLSLGNVLNAGFGQILILYNRVVRQTGDVIDTYVYRVGLLDANYEMATVVGIFKSVIGLILILLSYWLAGKLANYRIF